MSERHLLELTAFYADRSPDMGIEPTTDGRGFLLLNERRFVAEWSGGPNRLALRIHYDGRRPTGRALSDAGRGVLTFVIPYLFRTPAGFDLLVRGPANRPRDGIAPLEKLVAADRASTPFTMDWQFTRPGTITFEEGDPICMIVPQRRQESSRFRSAVRPVDEETERQWRSESRRRHGEAVRDFIARSPLSS